MLSCFNSFLHEVRMLWLFQVWGMDGQLLRCAVQRLPSCLPVAQSSAVLAEKIQHLSSHLPSNPLITLKVMFDLLIHHFACSLVSQISLLRWQTSSWLVLKLLCYLLMVEKCGSGNLQQLKVSFFSQQCTCQ